MSLDFLHHHVSLLSELIGVFVVFGMLIVIIGVAIALLDKVPVEDAIYLAFITAFTVGFGDVAPRSRGARILTVLLALIGLVLAGILVAVAIRALDNAVGANLP